MKQTEPGLAGVIRGLGLLAVVTAGISSILGTTSGSSSDPIGAIACAGRD